VEPRRIVVTGGTAGIGLAIARCLRKRDHQIFICGRDRDQLDAALRDLKLDGKSLVASGVVCDVRRLESVQSMITLARRELGGLDVLVNNAGIAFVKDFEEISPDMWSEIVDTNLTGVFNCSHAALPALKEAAATRGIADIVNIGSRSGRYSFKGGTGYNTTKFGLQGLTEAMFLDLSRHGIRVALVAPGTVATGLGGTQPKDWHLQPDDVALAVTNVIEAPPRASVNWVEIRPSRPPA
jgi:3-oxoacyl-[acyl-carrier protein] reductase